MATHELKTDRGVFTDAYNGLKGFEIRKNDRDFKESDTLILRETEFSGAAMAQGSPLIYTGREIECEVNYILHGPIYGLMDGWVIMDIEVVDHSSTPIRPQAADVKCSSPDCMGKFSHGDLIEDGDGVFLCPSCGAIIE